MKTVASLIWHQNSDIHLAQADVIQNLGYHHKFFNFDDPVPNDADIIFIQGPYGSLLPFVQNFSKIPPERKPVLIYWFQQCMHFLKPAWFRLITSRIFSDLHRSYGEAGLVGRILEFSIPSIIAHKGRRLSYLGDIVWLSQHKMIDLLALSSTYYAEHLNNFGITSMVVPRGYHPLYGTLQQDQRKIAIVWMGKLRTKRRQRTVFWLKDQMERLGQDMYIFDGQVNDFILGDRRTNILNQTRFVLNVFFSGPTDELSIRYFIAAANGAVILTEPGYNKYPFTPGEHIVESTIEEMPDKVMYYLSHPDEWEKISQNVYNLVTTELTLENSLKKIMGQAEILIAKRQTT